MIKKGLLVSLLFFIYGCAGTMRLAEEDKKGSTTSTETVIAKPNK